jgi:hypothetical protein
MLFKTTVLEGIKGGRITLAFRRWRKPTVRPGGSLRTSVGVLAIESVAEIAESRIKPTDAKRAGFASLEALRTDLDAQRDGTTYRIAFRLAGADPRATLRDRGRMDAGEIAALKKRLARLDRNAPWTAQCLHLIARSAGRPAAELAEVLGLEKIVAKRKIRQLKELGLTESLEVGYRLSKRGRAVLRALERG